MYTEKIIIITGKVHKATILPTDKDNVASNPTRAECAVDKIIPMIGSATTKPIKQAIELIFAIVGFLLWRFQEQANAIVKKYSWQLTIAAIVFALCGLLIITLI